MRNKVLHNFKAATHEGLINYKEERRHFVEGKLIDTTLI